MIKPSIPQGYPDTVHLNKGGMNSMEKDKSLREHLLYLLKDGRAHMDFDSAIKNLPADLRGKRPKGGKHSPWELLEHMRIAQWDILDFIRNANYESREFPTGYWPKEQAPPNEKAWDNAVKAFRADHKEILDLTANDSTDLFAKIPHGDGQTVLRELLLIADHNAYHLGQLVLVRNLLEA
jgi:uncharacterized damage-inducible protein DinB